MHVIPDIKRLKAKYGSNHAVIGVGAAGLKDDNTSTACFFSAQGLCFGDGGLHVADTGNHAIRFIGLAHGSATTVTAMAGRKGLHRAEAKGH